ncbi:MAG: ABC transporter ATP-binding protein [Candidatus Omnitrophica bacterium]|nr:ABC transporter ATP-binding protein [Candidatus Omnitrophota bacterium]
MLEVKHLHKFYNKDKAKLHVLKGVNLNIGKGEFVSLLGASGAGKSTLLHILGGLDLPSKGEVLLNNQNIYKIKDKDRAFLRNKKIGFVFQFYHLLSEFTALENIMLPALIAGGKKQKLKKKAEYLLERVGLEKRSTHRPSELSGGEQQRVAIVRALINDPEIVLCDEPTGNLDSKTGEKICGILNELNKEYNCTMVIATHSPLVAGISSRIIQMRDGMLENSA